MGSERTIKFKAHVATGLADGGYDFEFDVPASEVEGMSPADAVAYVTEHYTMAEVWNTIDVSTWLVEPGAEGR